MFLFNKLGEDLSVFRVHGDGFESAICLPMGDRIDGPWNLGGLSKRQKFGRREIILCTKSDMLIAMSRASKVPIFFANELTSTRPNPQTVNDAGTIMMG